ncbi:sugar nucleotidyltransferase [Bacillus sp. SM2101]|uniref:sugar phosphate nucleotidyltransferase n=1 Tax=Bacillus sp. SM2101 TaxID=2805366 RepID=UPI001BDF3DE3|nr:sugar nucleotidyltransferase [Bacillus sp. SM2101]
MKGVILAGGEGTRLAPFTKVINKHLLPVGSKPMIFWPIKSLKDTGIKNIILVINPRDLYDFITILGRGEKLGVKIKYVFQTKSKGISDALYKVRDHVSKEKFIVLLGDNIIGNSIKNHIDDYMKQQKGAKILLKKVEDPNRYGIAKLDNMGTIVSIEEKPIYPKSNLCVIGCYMYDEKVFDLIKNLKPSKRGELEITDLNNLYIEKGLMTYNIINNWWVDVGTHTSMLESNIKLSQEHDVE